MAGREDVRFPSGEADCAAWLYRPAAAADGPAPLVLLGHGLGAVREMRLDAYAERFAAAGFAALAFTYRYFGDSGGEPRQLLDIRRQHEDWRAALRFGRTLEGVRPDAIALWGSSFAGGHVLEIGASVPGIAAVVAQCPFTDGLASMRAADPKVAARMTAVALRDEIAGRTGRPAVRVPTAGAPGSLALMTAPDALEGVEKLAAGHDVDHHVTARVGLRIGPYRPGRALRRPHPPTLLCVCEHDSVAPAKAASAMPSAAATSRSAAIRSVTSTSTGATGSSVRWPTSSSSCGGT